jgi:hypothetical protein
MKKVVRILLLVLVAIFIIIQFIPYGKPSNQPLAGKDLFEVTELPQDVGIILKNACYDCHSQKVKFPWYSNVAPVSWLVARDIKEARENLDFSKWRDVSKKDKLKALDKIGEEVSEENMPMKIYTIMHAEARLTKAERDIVVKWAEDFAEKVFEE